MECVLHSESDFSLVVGVHFVSAWSDSSWLTRQRNTIKYLSRRDENVMQANYSDCFMTNILELTQEWEKLTDRRCGFDKMLLIPVDSGCGYRCRICCYQVLSKNQKLHKRMLQSGECGYPACSYTVTAVLAVPGNGAPSRISASFLNSVIHLFL